MVSSPRFPRQSVIPAGFGRSGASGDLHLCLASSQVPNSPTCDVFAPADPEAVAGAGAAHTMNA